MDAHFGGDLRRILGGNSDDVLDLVLCAGGIGGRQVDFVDDRQNLQPVFDGEIGVRKRLRLDALCRVDDEHRTLTRGERTRDLIVEVDMARRVDQIHLIGFAVLRFVVHAHSARFDRDAALALEVHVVEQLAFHLALCHRVALLQQTIRQRGFAVVNMRHDRKIADERLILHAFSFDAAAVRVPRQAFAADTCPPFFS